MPLPWFDVRKIFRELITGEDEPARPEPIRRKRKGVDKSYRDNDYALDSDGHPRRMKRYRRSEYRNADFFRHDRDYAVLEDSDEQYHDDDNNDGHDAGHDGLNREEEVFDDLVDAPQEYDDGYYDGYYDGEEGLFDDPVEEPQMYDEDSVDPDFDDGEEVTQLNRPDEHDGSALPVDNFLPNSTFPNYNEDDLARLSLPRTPLIVARQDAVVDRLRKLVNNHDWDELMAIRDEIRSINNGVSDGIYDIAADRILHDHDYIEQLLTNEIARADQLRRDNAPAHAKFGQVITLEDGRQIIVTGSEQSAVNHHDIIQRPNAGGAKQAAHGHHNNHHHANTGGAKQPARNNHSNPHQANVGGAKQPAPNHHNNGQQSNAGGAKQAAHDHHNHTQNSNTPRTPERDHQNPDPDKAQQPIVDTPQSMVYKAGGKIDHFGTARKHLQNDPENARRDLQLVLNEPEHALRDIEIRDAIDHLSRKMKKFAERYFHFFSDNRGIDAALGNLRPETTKIIGCVASGGPGGEQAWHEFFSDRNQRVVLVMAIIGNVISEQVWQHSAFGADGNILTELKDMQKDQQNIEGFDRIKDTANLLQGHLIRDNVVQYPPNFIDHTSAITTAIWHHLDPILQLNPALNNTGDIKTEVLKKLVKLVAWAGAISLQMRLDPHTAYHVAPLHKEQSVTSAEHEIYAEVPRHPATTPKEQARERSDIQIIKVAILNGITAYRPGHFETKWSMASDPKWASMPHQADATVTGPLLPRHTDPNTRQMGTRSRILTKGLVYVRWGRLRKWQNGQPADDPNVHGQQWRGRGFVEFRQVKNVRQPPPPINPVQGGGDGRGGGGGGGGEGQQGDRGGHHGDRGNHHDGQGNPNHPAQPADPNQTTTLQPGHKTDQTPVLPITRRGLDNFNNNTPNADPVPLTGIHRPRAIPPRRQGQPSITNVRPSNPQDPTQPHTPTPTPATGTKGHTAVTLATKIPPLKTPNTADPAKAPTTTNDPDASGAQSMADALAHLRAEVERLKASQKQAEDQKKKAQDEADKLRKEKQDRLAGGGGGGSRGSTHNTGSKTGTKSGAAGGNDANDDDDDDAGAGNGNGDNANDAKRRSTRASSRRKKRARRS